MLLMWKWMVLSLRKNHLWRCWDCFHSVHWGINPPLKNTLPPLSCQPPLLKLANCSSPPFLGNHPLYIGFSWTPPLPSKSWIFQWTPPKILKCFILNTIFKISQFEFLVMTVKNAFAYKLLSLNISDFYFIFYVKIVTPWKK